MTILTGNDALRAKDAATRISTSAFTMSPHLWGMYRLADGRIAEHHCEFGAHHRLLICTESEAAILRNRPMSRNLS